MTVPSAAPDGKLLWDATDDELLSVLGAQVLPLVTTPSDFLTMGRRGSFYVSGSLALGGSEEFKHRPLQEIARKFLKAWKKELETAVCGNSELAGELKRRGSEQMDILIGVAAGALATSIPELSHFGGVLSVLALLIIRSGTKAFCRMLTELS